MAKQNINQNQISKEITKFEETMQELYLLKNISKILKNLRRMIKLKKYD